MALNDTSILAVQGTWVGQRHIHTLAFRSQVIGDAEQALIDEWQSACRTAYRAIFPGGHNPVELLTARQVCGALPLRAAVEEVEPPATGSGTRSVVEAVLAPWLTGLISVRTASAGKSRRGRNFIGGLAESDILGSTISGPWITAVTAYYTALMNTFGPSGTSTTWRWVIHSHKLALEPGAPPCQNTSTPVTGFIVRPTMTTMKSRKVGSGV
jgi:hypothetical protein